MKIGVLGTGLMGSPMALKLLESNYEVMAYNRTPEKLIPLKNEGIVTTTSPLEIVEKCECLILMLSHAAAIKEVILSSEIKQKLKDHTIIQMGTIKPSESKSIHDEINSVGGEYLEAPVLGSIPQVKTGELIVMVGATTKLFEKWQPILQCFGSQPSLIGNVGKAAALKLALNQLIAGLTTSFALSLSFIQSQGVEVTKFMDILHQSSLYAGTFDKKLSRMCDRNFRNPNFPTKHLLKDVNLLISEAETSQLNTSILEAISKMIEQTIALGLAEEDYSAVYSAIAGEK